jgi:ATP-dependent RNA helicase RhlE
MSFALLGLTEPLVRAVLERGYTQPTPIQTQAIPAVLSGGDLLAGAQTGTGKTAGFTLPILQRLMDTPAPTATSGRAPIRVLILTPTRELAAQVEESVRDYGVHLPITSMVIFGGVGMQPQVDRLKKRVDILVATPGRLLDHVQQKTLDLSHVEILVLDEADRMLDMGFIRDIKRVLALLPKKRQNLLFSATFSDEIRTLAHELLNNPATIEVARRNAPTELVDQKAVSVEKGAKRALLSHLIRTQRWFQVLVFTRTKHGANRLAEQLGKDGIAAMAIHGNKSQGARTRALSEFKDGKLQVLVATDIAARGLDIVELPYVVNFELPNVPEDYVHRIGRTGRAGATGVAMSLVSAEERPLLADIEKLLKKPLPKVVIEDFDMNAAIAAARVAEPRGGEDRPERGRGGQRGGQRGEGRRDDGQPRRQPAAQGQARPAAVEQPRAAAPAAQPRQPRAERAPGQGQPRADRGPAQPRGERGALQARAERPLRAERGSAQPRGERIERGNAAPAQPRFTGERDGNTIARRPAGQQAARRAPVVYGEDGEPNGNVMPRFEEVEVNGNVMPRFEEVEVNGNVMPKHSMVERDGNRGQRGDPVLARTGRAGGQPGGKAAGQRGGQPGQGGPRGGQAGQAGPRGGQPGQGKPRGGQSGRGPRSGGGGGGGGGAGGGNGGGNGGGRSQAAAVPSPRAAANTPGDAQPAADKPRGIRGAFASAVGMFRKLG